VLAGAAATVAACACGSAGLCASASTGTTPKIAAPTRRFSKRCFGGTVMGAIFGHWQDAARASGLRPARHGPAPTACTPRPPPGRGAAFTSPAAACAAVGGGRTLASPAADAPPRPIFLLAPWHLCGLRWAPCGHGLCGATYPMKRSWAGSQDAATEQQVGAQAGQLAQALQRFVHRIIRRVVHRSIRQHRVGHCFIQHAARWPWPRTSRACCSPRAPRAASPALRSARPPPWPGPRPSRSRTG